jgi:hypothetical protein
MIRAFLVLCLAFLLAPAAGALEPKKPSQLVTLVASDDCESGAGFLYGTRLLPDGTATAFTIPPKQVLVVTRWGFNFNGGSGLAGANAFLRIDGTSAAIAHLTFAFDAEGRAGDAVDLQGVVGEGRALCGYHNAGASVTPGSGFVEGYLTKAR